MFLINSLRKGIRFTSIKLKVNSRNALPSRGTYRNFSSQPPAKTKLHKTSNIAFIITGLAGAASVGAFLYVSRRPGDKETSKKNDDMFTDDVYIEDKLDEKLRLLEENGPVPYLLIGAGTASFAASRAIRASDENSKVVILGEEGFHPYMRPPLSKEMWFEGGSDKRLTFKQWNGKERSVFFESEDFYTSIEQLIQNPNGGVAVLRGVKVIRVDPLDQIAYLDNGKTLKYQKCLIATGGKPKNLQVFEKADEDLKKHVTLFRNVKDFQKLNHICKKAKSITIVGGGFLGSELACALSKQNLKVTQIFPEDGNMGKVLPDYLSNWTTNKVRAQGVEVKPKINISSVSKDSSKIQLKLTDGQTISSDHVIVAVGLSPNTELAATSGLEVDGHEGGFLVNAELEARKNLWIAGDAASFYDVKLGRRRVEHHDHAVVSGRLAGENMTGRGKHYWHQSMFWSDLGPEIGYEAIGICDSSLETVGVFSKATEKDTPKVASETTGEGLRSEVSEQKSTESKFESTVPRSPKPDDNFGKGIIFYLRNNTVVGIVLWNVFTKIPIARRIINEAIPNQDLAEVAKLFDLKEEEKE